MNMPKWQEEQAEEIDTKVYVFHLNNLFINNNIELLNIGIL